MPSQSVSCPVSLPVCGRRSGSATLDDLLPHLRGLALEGIECTPSAVVIWARCRPAEAVCPACGTWSSRVHGSYVRQVRDLPLGGRPVLIRLAVRRFVCTNATCRKLTFARQADGLTARYQRRSVPLAGLLSQVAPELAGRAGMRLAGALGAAVHRGTLLRLVIDLPEPTISSAPEVVGVDDFALRRGHVYATILVDAATGRAIGILPGREAGPLAEWLKARREAADSPPVVLPRAALLMDGARQAEDITVRLRRQAAG